MNRIHCQPPFLPMTDPNAKKQVANLPVSSVFSAQVVSEKDGLFTLQTKDASLFTAPVANIQGDVGDTLAFEVVANNKDEWALKQLVAHTNKQNHTADVVRKSQSTKDMFVQSNLLDKDPTHTKDAAREQLEEQLETSRAIAAIKHRLFYGANHTSESAVSQLLASGICLQKMSFDVLSRVMTHIETAPMKPTTDQQAAQALHDFLSTGATNTAHTPMIVEALTRHHVPVNEKNVASVQHTIDRAQTATPVNENTTAQLLLEDTPLTLNSLYVAHFTTTDMPTNAPLSPSAQAQLDKEVTKVFQREGIAHTPENFELANFLLSKNVPITKQSIEKALFLRDLHLLLTDDIVASQAAKSLQDGVIIGQSPLQEWAGNPVSPLTDTYQDILTSLPTLTATKIDLLLRNNVPLTLKNLRHMPQTNPTKPLQPLNQAAASLGRKQLVQLQAQLTYEAAARLAGNNINIDTMPLQEALNALENTQNESYAHNLATMDAPATPENVSQMRLLYQRMAESTTLTCNVFANADGQSASYTVTGIHQAVALAKRNQNYDTFATVPSPKYGDSFALVRKQFGSLLETLGIAPTDKNVKAAAILSKNKLDVNQENIDNVKLIDAKIETIQNKLHPNIAAAIIKEGMNPAHMHLDDLLATIGHFEDQYGANMSETVAFHVLEMDRQNPLPPPQRDAMIAIYRMLNAISKDGGVALGVTLANDGNQTLGSLLEASKYYDQTKGKSNVFAFDVDNDFGMLQKLNIPKGNITAALETGAATTLHSLALHAVADKANPSALAACLTDPDFLSLPLEDAAQTLADAANDQAVTQQSNLSQQLAEVFQSPATTIHWMTQNAIPTTPTNLMAMNHLRKDPFFMGHALEQLDDATKADLEDTLLDTKLSALDNGATPKQMLQALSTRLPTAQHSLQQALHLQSGIQNRDGNQDIKLPVKLHDKIASLNVYVVNPNTLPTDTNRVLFALNTTNLGNVQIYATLSQDQVSLSVHSDNPDAMAHLLSDQKTLLGLLDEYGLRADKVTFGVEPVHNILEEDLLPHTAQPSLGNQFEVKV